MSYSEDRAELTLFSKNRTSLTDLTSSLAAKLDKKGSQYHGPIPLPAVDNEELRHFLTFLKNPESMDTWTDDDFRTWLFEIVTDDENIDQIVSIAKEGSNIYARKIIVVGSMSISAIFSFDMPADVFAVANVDKIEHNKGQGFDPYSWDPNNDHIPSHPDGW